MTTAEETLKWWNDYLEQNKTYPLIAEIEMQLNLAVDNEKQVKNIGVTHCCTELNHDLKIGDKVVVTNRYVATISAFCADNDLIEIEDGCDYKQVDKEDVTKVV